MANCSNEDVIELISGVVKDDFLSIMESANFGSLHNKLTRVDPRLSLPAAPSCEFPQAIRALKLIASDRRSVNDLLQENLCSILANGLVGLSKDRVKRLLELMSWVNLTERTSHHELESLKGISQLGCCMQVEYVHSSNP